MIDFEKKIALIGAITALASVLLSPAITWITTKKSIDAQIKLKELERSTELQKIKLEKTIQVKNDAYADLFLNIHNIGTMVFFAEYRPSKESEKNIVQALLLRQQELNDKIFMACYRLLPLISSQDKKQQIEKLTGTIISQYSMASSETLKPRLEMDYKKLDLISQKFIPSINQNISSLKTILNEELEK